MALPVLRIATSPLNPLVQSLVTLNCTLAGTLPLAIGGGCGCTSSFVIIPIAVPRASVAPTGADRSRKKSSSDSNTESPATLTFTVLLVWPGAKVSFPLVAV